MESISHERGFTLIEVLVGSAIGIVILSTLVALVHHVAASATHLNSRLNEQNAATTLLERMQSDAASAWALWVPATDVLGKSNSDGHELDFFAQDASHRNYAWAYAFDSATQTVTRYEYASSVAAAASETYAPVSAFSAAEFAPSALANPSSALYDPLFAGASFSEVRHAFGAFANAYGGNDLLQVHIGAGGVAFDQTLASATAPSTFTIVVQYTPTPAPAATPIPTPFPLGAFTPVPAPS